MAIKFGLNAQMMLFANEEQRKLSSVVLPVAEVLDRAQKLSQATTAYDKTRLTSSVLLTLGDLSQYNAMLTVAEVAEVKDLKTIVKDGKYDSSKKAKIEAALKKANADDLTSLGLTDASADATKLKGADDKLNGSGATLQSIIVLAQSDKISQIKPLYTEVIEIQGKPDEEKLNADTYKKLKTDFNNLKSSLDLNIVEISKEIEKNKIQSLAPVRVKKATVVKGLKLEESEMKKWIPEQTVIEQLSYDFDSKEGAFEIIVNPGDDFPTNGKPDLFYLSRGAMLIKKEV